MTNKLAKIKEIISMLFEALLFNRAGEASNSPELILLKSHSRCVEKEMCDNFEGGKPLLLKFSDYVGMIQMFGTLDWNNSLTIKSP